MWLAQAQEDSVDVEDEVELNPFSNPVFFLSQQIARDAFAQLQKEDS